MGWETTNFPARFEMTYQLTATENEVGGHMPTWRRRSSLQAASILKGLYRSAQGFRAREATLGHPSERSINPERVASQHRDDATPLGLMHISMRLPRVARSSQPWAERLNPVGIQIGISRRCGSPNPPPHVGGYRASQTRLPNFIRGLEAGEPQLWQGARNGSEAAQAHFNF